MIEVEGYRAHEDYYYEPTHAWMRIEDDGTVTVGLDDFGQKAAGNIVFIDVPDVGTRVEKGKKFTSIESSKWIGEINSPVTGEIIESNEELWDNPRLVNEDPFGAGWIVKVRPEKLEEETADLVTGDAIADWIRKDIKEILKGGT
ncbi:MAG: glycine cleavage system protein GcvH [Candidatus Bathyarchaeia archaeon]